MMTDPPHKPPGITPAWTVRRAKRGDADAVTQVVHAAYDVYVNSLGITPGPLLADYTMLIAEQKVELAELDAEIIGVVVTTAVGDDFLIENVAVSPRHQGLGLGSAMLSHAESRAEAAGHHSVRLFTHELMSGNVARYHRRGYTIYAHEPLPGGGQLVHMRKPLHPAGAPPPPVQN